MPNQISINGDKIGPLTLPAKNTTIVGQVKLNSLTGLNLLLQARISTSLVFQTIKMKDPVTGTEIGALTTDGQIGWAENIGYSDFQFIQSGAVGGTGPADVAVNVGDD